MTHLMTIGIDYDGTFTNDPAFWRAFIRGAIQHGHHPIIVTYRPDAEAIRFGAGEVREAIGDICPIVFCQPGQTKREASQKAEYRVSVWIDDRPEGIGAVAATEAEIAIQTLWRTANNLQNQARLPGDLMERMVILLGMIDRLPQAFERYLDGGRAYLNHMDGCHVRTGDPCSCGFAEFVAQERKRRDG